jgi:hypothetical protein
MERIGHGPTGETIRPDRRSPKEQEDSETLQLGQLVS